MNILGIDPGLAIVGYGVVEVEDNGSYRLKDVGVIKTPAGVPLPRRLGQVFDGVAQLCEMFSPAAIAIEELFFAKNAATALPVAHARGALLAACTRFTDEIYEYTPLQVKQAVVGYGKADKHQVGEMVKLLLKLAAVPKPDDAADAVAVALCHIHTVSMQSRFKIQ